MIAVLFGGAVALLPIFAEDILQVGSKGFGILRAAPAVGAFLTMLVTAYIPISKNAGLKLLGAIFGFGICIIIFGLSSIFWVLWWKWVCGMGWRGVCRERAPHCPGISQRGFCPSL